MFQHLSLKDKKCVFAYHLIRKHRFMKKIPNFFEEYFSQARQSHLAVSDIKSSDYRQKNLIFSLCRDLPGPEIFLRVVNT